MGKLNSLTVMNNNLDAALLRLAVLGFTDSPHAVGHRKLWYDNDNDNDNLTITVTVRHPTLDADTYAMSVFNPDLMEDKWKTMTTNSVDRLVATIATILEEKDERKAQTQ